MSEDYYLCSTHLHHKFKILHCLSAMRSYKDELVKLGKKVHYFGIENDAFYDDYLIKLLKCVKKDKQ